MQHERKAVAEHVNTDQQRQDLQGTQCADADGRVLQNIEHLTGSGSASKLGAKAEIRGSCGKDQHPAATERQNARTAACRVHSRLRIDQLDIFFLPRPDRQQCVPPSLACARCFAFAACFLGSGFHDLPSLGGSAASFLPAWPRGRPSPPRSSARSCAHACHFARRAGEALARASSTDS